MAKKLKINRTFTYKAYECENYLNLLNLNNINECENYKNLIKSHTGKFLFKSECHYYTEKYILDFINNNYNNLTDANIYLIYKINTEEDKNIEDLLIELIYIKNNKIYII